MKKGILVLSVIGVGIIFSVAAAEEIRYDKDDRRDPFLPATGAHVGTLGKEGLTVEGIVFDPKGNSYVLIGGQIYREGESIENAKLIKILPDRAILLQDSEQVVIWLREEALQEKQRENGRDHEKG